ncbi:MAG TPA: hypothetical protein VFH27_02895 [Longimicrobiaceae bacterium]|nr:hypothetical protein [Longimicrobiaceae bacterium]
MSATATSRFLHVPADLLSSVRRALVNDREPLEAVTLLREVGYEVGGSVYGDLWDHVSHDNGGAHALSVPAERFWESASGYFQGLGWGTLEHSQPHPGIGAVDLVDWMEAGSDGGPPGCHISTGLFTDLLMRLADGEPVVVMEVPAGSGRSRLLFGSQEALGAVYAALQGGATPDQAIASLG